MPNLTALLAALDVRERSLLQAEARREDEYVEARARLRAIEAGLAARVRASRPHTQCTAHTVDLPSVHC